MDLLKNIQFCPTPIFYLKRGEVRAVADRIGSAGAIAAGNATSTVLRAVADATGCAGSIIGGFSMNSTSYALTENVALNVNFAHGMGTIPGYRRLALVCTTNDPGSGMVAGQECDAQAIWDDDENVIAFNCIADNSKFYLSKTPCLSNALAMTIGGVMQFFTSMNHFSLKIYWQ